MGRTIRWLVMLGGAVLVVPGISHCGGRSSDTDERSGGDDAGEPAGGTTSGSAGTGQGGSGATGGSTGGTGATGGSAGTAQGGSGGSDPISLCRLPAESGSCDVYTPSFWFDASSGVCIPFIYTGCEGNDNRFSTLEECYAACGGQGDRDDAACTLNTDCVAQRFAEPCCTTDLHNFVGVNRLVQFQCSIPELGCNAACAADCDGWPEDGYIGATCDSGHCIPFDARARGFTSCDSDSDCALVYGMGCCGNDCCSPGFCSGCPSQDCPLERQPSKLVAIGRSEELQRLICDPGINCPGIDLCEYPENVRPVCESGTCMFEVSIE
jgi:hypothetical protein